MLELELLGQHLGIGQHPLADLLAELLDRVGGRRLEGAVPHAGAGQAPRPVAPLAVHQLDERTLARPQQVRLGALGLLQERALREGAGEGVEPRHGVVELPAPLQQLGLVEVVHLLLTLRLGLSALELHRDLRRVLDLESQGRLVVAHRRDVVEDPLAVGGQRELGRGVVGRGARGLLRVELVPRVHVEGRHLDAARDRGHGALRHDLDVALAPHDERVALTALDDAEDLGAVGQHEAIHGDEQLLGLHLDVPPVPAQGLGLDGVHQGPGQPHHAAVLDAAQDQPLVVVLDHLGPVQRATAQLDRDDLAREHGPERRRGIEPLLGVPGPAERGGVLEQGHGGGREGDEECDGGADPGHGASPRASEPRNRRRMRSPKGTSLSTREV